MVSLSLGRDSQHSTLPISHSTLPAQHSTLPTQHSTIHCLHSTYHAPHSTGYNGTVTGAEITRLVFVITRFARVGEMCTEICELNKVFALKLRFINQGLYCAAVATSLKHTGQYRNHNPKYIFGTRWKYKDVFEIFMLNRNHQPVHHVIEPWTRPLCPPIVLPLCWFAYSRPYPHYIVVRLW